MSTHTKGRNHTKGRPHLLGNQGRKGRPRPAGSGRPKIFKDPVNVTIVADREDLDFWRREAAACNISLGEYIRNSLINHV